MSQSDEYDYEYELRVLRSPETRLLRQFYPDVQIRESRHTLLAAMLLSYVPQFKLLNGIALPKSVYGYSPNGTVLEFTVPPFIRETVSPPLPSVLRLRMTFHIHRDGTYRFDTSSARPLDDRFNRWSNKYKVNENWLRDFASHSMQRTEKEILNSAFTSGENIDGLNNFREFLWTEVDEETSTTLDIGDNTRKGYSINIEVKEGGSVLVEVALGGLQMPFDNLRLLPDPLREVIEDVYALGPLREVVKGLPKSTISAEQRARIMGITEEKCNWTDYTPEKCNGDVKDPITFEEFKAGDRVWQTSSGQCFGPDPDYNPDNPRFGEFYRADYFPNSDIFRNPVNRNRLEERCFMRVEDHLDDEFPPARRVRQRTEE